MTTLNHTTESAFRALPPGCDEIMAGLEASIKLNRLPHALLFSGPRGIGKSHVATAFARILLDIRVSDGHPRHADLIEAGTHPDLIEVRPEAGKTVISVDQVRQLSQRLSLTSHSGAVKVVIIEPAESMNAAASNALLKTLEEPPGDTVIMLLTSNKGRLPQTIKSRCQPINFQLPSAEASLKWLEGQIEEGVDIHLEMAQGAPVLALDYHDAGLADSYGQLMQGLAGLLSGKTDPLSQARACSDIPTRELIGWIKSLVSALIRQKMIGETELNNLTNLLNHLKISVNPIDLGKLLSYQDYLNQAEREIDANLNHELFVEELFIRWSVLANS